jgi:preflagellin peptidase FlaK
MPAPWVVFTNAILLFLLIPLSLFLFNLAHKQLRFPHSFVGYTMSIEKAKQTFVWPMERFVNGKPKLVLMHKSFDADEEIEQFEQKGYTTIWVTPKIPFMIPLLAGFIATFTIGDLLSTAINYLISLFI